MYALSDALISSTMPVLFSSMTMPRRHSRTLHKNKTKQSLCLVPGCFSPRCNSMHRLVCLCHIRNLIDALSQALHQIVSSFGPVESFDFRQPELVDDNG